MRKIIAGAALALLALALNPTPSRALERDPQRYHGYGWLRGNALNVWPWLHFHGPLYNYGPYTTPGHVPMFVPNRWCDQYLPAYPVAYYGYEQPAYVPNTIQPYFPASPTQILTAPINPYNYQTAPPGVTVPLANAPATEQPATAQPSVANYYNGRTPAFFGQFRTGLRR